MAAPTAPSTTAAQSTFSANTISGTGRSRPQARRKANDDANYGGAEGAGAKRVAQERAEGEPRVKRKRVEQGAVGTQQTSLGTNARYAKVDGDSSATSLVDFTALPTAALYRYIAHYDLVPCIFPTPLGADDPPPPIALLEPARMGSRGSTPGAGTTAANRPRRVRETNRRRSSRLVEEEGGGGLVQTPVVGDVGDVHGVLAQIVSRHFGEWTVKEVDTLASFMCAVKNNNR